jgi:hypothetical protein
MCAPFPGLPTQAGIHAFPSMQITKSWMPAAAHMMMLAPFVHRSFGRLVLVFRVFHSAACARSAWRYNAVLPCAEPRQARVNANERKSAGKNANGPEWLVRPSVCIDEVRWPPDHSGQSRSFLLICVHLR